MAQITTMGFNRLQTLDHKKSLVTLSELAANQVSTDQPLNHKCQPVRPLLSLPVAILMIHAPWSLWTSCVRHLGNAFMRPVSYRFHAFLPGMSGTIAAMAVFA